MLPLLWPKCRALQRDDPAAPVSSVGTRKRCDQQRSAGNSPATAQKSFAGHLPLGAQLSVCSVNLPEALHPDAHPVWRDRTHCSANGPMVFFYIYTSGGPASQFCLDVCHPFVFRTVILSECITSSTNGIHSVCFFFCFGEGKPQMFNLISRIGITLTQ